jgi:lipopolysaccharide cholinephosphotransferase
MPLESERKMTADNSVRILSVAELRGLQRVLSEMLIELNRICKTHNIRYCIIAGTMLGAVRHKGFIPWDDDLDVAMARGEYERFRKACETELDAERFFFQDHATDPHYRWGYGRLRRKDSEFVRVGQEHMKMRTGIFIDVFPVDSVPDFPPFRGLFAFWCFFLRKVLYAETGAEFVKTKYLRFVYRMLNKIPAAWAFRRLEQLQNWGKGRRTKYVRILTFPTPKGRPYGYLRKWYENVEDIEFEGGIFPGVKDWDEYLTYKFGDYLILPQENERHRHPVSKFELPEK